MKWVTIYRFTYPHEAITICSKLEGEGIECILQDQLTTQVMPLYSNALGGVKLQVKESDVPAALEILMQAGMVEEPDTADKVEKLLQDVLQINGAGSKPKFLPRLALLAMLFGLIIAGILYLLGTHS